VRFPPPWTVENTGRLFRRARRARYTRKSSFVVHYRFGGKQRKFTVGNAAKINADQARKIALTVLGQIASGTDPQAEREAERVEAARLTFEQAVEQYLAAKQSELRASSLKLASLYLSGTKYFPLRKALDDVTRADVAHSLDRIARTSGAPSASWARAHISSLFTWALRRGLCHENPVLQTEEPKGGAERDRVLSGAELKTVWDCCDT
jgi:hypothetical protein